MTHYLRIVTITRNYTLTCWKEACITPWADFPAGNYEFSYSVDTCTPFPTFEAAERELYARYPQAVRQIKAPSVCNYDIGDRCWTD